MSLSSPLTPTLPHDPAHLQNQWAPDPIFLDRDLETAAIMSQRVAKTTRDRFSCLSC